MFQVAPPSTDTSTLATEPPPASLDVPLMRTLFPNSLVNPDPGNVIIEVGRKASGVGVGVGLVGVLGLFTIPHPEASRIELTTASPIRTTKTLP